MTSALNLPLAFVAGLGSFASPCVLPLIPAYLSFITGSSLEELRLGAPAARLHLLAHASAFCLGFSLIFVAAGLVAGSIGNSLQADRQILSRLGGLITIVLGLQMLGILRLDTLMKDRRLSLGRSEKRTLITSLLVGIGFAAGWSPCIGPMLSGILILAARQATAQAALLLSAYSIGLAVPFLLCALALDVALEQIRRFQRFVRLVEIGAGAILVAIGLVLITGSFAQFSGLLAHTLGSS